MQSLSTKLSPLQLELLKVYSFHPSEEDLLAIRQYLANYFANKLVKQVDKAVEENDITDEKLKSWLNEKA
ncbi:MAG: hypothetical protein IPN76_16185 [Saprospiraceae bacterium]|nr:hypothetical protein [Saprospiraceae bacterium]